MASTVNKGSRYLIAFIRVILLFVTSGFRHEERGSNDELQLDHRFVEIHG
ncbi:MAG: hypothetical protein JWR69_274, partial [Pedosphaera sp.]|nr:hypothetical protein [Pedosphaera sp.]